MQLLEVLGRFWERTAPVLGILLFLVRVLTFFIRRNPNVSSSRTWRSGRGSSGDNPVPRRQPPAISQAVERERHPTVKSRHLALRERTSGLRLDARHGKLNDPARAIQSSAPAALQQPGCCSFDHSQKGFPSRQTAAAGRGRT